MYESNKITVNGGIGFTGLLTIVFIVLKLTGYINWSWIWVFAPLWICILIYILVIIIAALYFSIKEIKQKNK